jgi:hypothetical protein
VKTLRNALIASTAALSVGAGVVIYNTVHQAPPSRVIVAQDLTSQQRLDQAFEVAMPVIDPVAEIDRQLAEHPFYINGLEPQPLVAVAEAAERTPQQRLDQATDALPPIDLLPLPQYVVELPSGMDMEFDLWAWVDQQAERNAAAICPQPTAELEVKLCGDHGTLIAQSATESPYYGGPYMSAVPMSPNGLEPDQLPPYDGEQMSPEIKTAKPGGIGSDYVASPPHEETTVAVPLPRPSPLKAFAKKTHKWHPSNRHDATAQPRGFSVFSILRLFNVRFVVRSAPRRYASAPRRHHIASAPVARKQQLVRREVIPARREAPSSSNDASFVSVK